MKYRRIRPRFSKTLKTRFLAKVDPSAGADACWRFLGAHSRKSDGLYPHMRPGFGQQPMLVAAISLVLSGRRKPFPRCGALPLVSCELVYQP
jgi:hypothetical protein